MDKLEELEVKIDKLQASVEALTHFIVQQDACDFQKDVEANILADVIFEMVVNPDSFFDSAGGR